MDYIYKSKIGPPILFPLCTVGGSFIAMLFTRAWPAVAVTGVLTLVMVHMCFNTYYTISGNFLLIKNSFVINKKIDIGTIRKIVPAKDMRSAPALSMDRLEIFFNQDDSILISPEDKADFIHRLKFINPTIE